MFNVKRRQRSLRNKLDRIKKLFETDAKNVDYSVDSLAVNSIQFRFFPVRIRRGPQSPLPNPPPSFDPRLATTALGCAPADRAAAVHAFPIATHRGHDDCEDPWDGLDAEDARILHTLAL